MLTITNAFRAVLFAGLAAGISPASAQNERSRSGRAADEIARGVREAAEAIATVRDAYDENVDGIRFGRQERLAINRCRPHVERYGRMRVDDVRRYGRRSWRAVGTVNGEGRYDRNRSSRHAYASRTFTCTVRDDGRVKLKTRRVRY